MSRFGRFLPAATSLLVARILPVGALAPVALASVVANVAIVVTGGAVRLTDSGLGCPTWPRCTDGSYRNTPEMGIHGTIEFGNRMLTFAVGLIALAGLLAALAHRSRSRRLVPLATVVLLGIPAQAVIGGFTVLTNLNPWVVNLHFLASMAVIAAAYAYWSETRAATAGTGAATNADTAAAGVGGAGATAGGAGTATARGLPGPVRTLAALIAVVSALVLVVGTWVTGSGPHSGDHGAARNGLDPQEVSQAHADLVFLLLGLSVALWFALRAVDAPAGAVRAAAWLVGVELAQGLVGLVQYFTDLPRVLVGAHMLGACLVWLATLAALRHTRAPLPAAAPPAAGAQPSPAQPAETEPGEAQPAETEPGEAQPVETGPSRYAMASAKRPAAPLE